MHAFVEEKDTTQAYLTTPMSWLQRSNLARIRTRSHVLAVDKGAWTGVPRADRCCELCAHMRVLDDDAHVLLFCPRYAHIRARFESLLHKQDNVCNLLNKSNPKVLSKYVIEVLTHREHLLTTQGWCNVFCFGPMGLEPQVDVNKISLSLSLSLSLDARHPEMVQEMGSRGLLGKRGALMDTTRKGL